MTISPKEYNPHLYYGNDVTTVFPIHFSFVEEDDIIVTNIDADEVETVWANGTDYSISNYYPYSVVSETALPSGEQLRIERSTNLTQVKNLIESYEYESEDQEDNNDKITMICQEIDYKCRDLFETDVENFLFCIDGGVLGGGSNLYSVPNLAASYNQVVSKYFATFYYDFYIYHGNFACFYNNGEAILQFVLKNDKVISYLTMTEITNDIVCTAYDYNSNQVWLLTTDDSDYFIEKFAPFSDSQISITNIGDAMTSPVSMTIHGDNVFILDSELVMDGSGITEVNVFQFDYSLTYIDTLTSSNLPAFFADSIYVPGITYDGDSFYFTVWETDYQTEPELILPTYFYAHIMKISSSSLDFTDSTYVSFEDITIYRIYHMTKYRLIGR